MQVSKQNRLDAGEDAHRLSTRQIQRICRRHGWHCQMHKEPNVPNTLATDHRYRKSNSVKVARNGDWLPLGWKWDIEVLDEAQIVELLKAFEQSHNSEHTGLSGTQKSHA